MVSEREEQLAAIRRELTRQDAEWERAKRAVQALGQAELAVPSQALAELDEVCTVRTASNIDFNAVRG